LAATVAAADPASADGFYGNELFCHGFSQSEYYAF